jgi:hypothetical protein
MIATDTERLQHVLSEALANEWTAQGHEMTGAIVKNIDYVVKQETDSLTISGMMYPYGMIIAAGVKWSKIPYSGRSGRGGTSMYIQGLQSWVKLRMNISDEKKSLGVAFAIAQTQKREGMPTKGSYGYSSSGKRTIWIEEAFKHNEDLIVSTIREMCYNLLSVKFDVVLNEWQKMFDKN